MYSSVQVEPGGGGSALATWSANASSSPSAIAKIFARVTNFDVLWHPCPDITAEGTGRAGRASQSSVLSPQSSVDCFLQRLRRWAPGVAELALCLFAAETRW